MNESYVECLVAKKPSGMLNALQDTFVGDNGYRRGRRDDILPAPVCGTCGRPGSLLCGTVCKHGIRVSVCGQRDFRGQDF